MGYTYRQELTKFDYAICLAAALCYLMIHQQDPVGLLTFDTKIRHSLRPKTRRSHLGDVLSLLANLKPEGETDIAASLTQVAAMLRHASLVMIFSDLLADPTPMLQSLYRLRHGGHDVILFHILDEAEVQFPFQGMVEFGGAGDAAAPGVGRRRIPPRSIWTRSRRSAPVSPRVFSGRVDYVPLDTRMRFDRALTEYLMRRSERG